MTRVKGSRHLCAAERSVGELTAVFASKGDALRRAVVDDVDAGLRQAIDIAFTGAKIAAFNGVVKQAMNAVAVILIILSRIDAALCRDAVGATR
jgi:hypothetical protein